MPITIPTPDEYGRLAWERRVELIARFRRLLADYEAMS